MARLVRVNAGQKQVALPNGEMYDGPVEVTLTDTEYARIAPNAFDTVLTDLGAVPNVSEEDLPPEVATDAEVAAALADKADAAEVTAALADKADDDDVTTALAAKADADDVTTALAGKVDAPASGTASATTFLRGDGTWAEPDGGGGASLIDQLFREPGLLLLGGASGASSSTPSAWGLMNPLSTAGASSGSQGLYPTLHTGTTINTTAGFRGPASFSVLTKPMVRIGWVNQTIGAARAFAGLTQQSLDTTLADDNPTPSLFGVGFSTALGHTTWHFMMRGVANAGTLERIDTGVAFAINVNYAVRVYSDDAINFVIELLNGDTGAILATHTTATENQRPGTTERMGAGVGLRTLEASNKVVLLRGALACTRA